MLFFSICCSTLALIILSGCNTIENKDKEQGQNRISQNSIYYDGNKLDADMTSNVNNNQDDSNEENTIDFSNVDTKTSDISDDNASMNSNSKPIEIASYSTKILTNDSNRYNNIKIVSDRLNGKTLESGQTFSFNETCGPYGKSDGFLEATILLSDGSEEKGYGGGVCQLSSTLYNAVLEANLEIVEHHHHSTAVAYVPKDKDATVSLQSNLDFKFKNNQSYPIKLRTSYDPDNLSVYIDKY